eukprot:scaffold126538_cov22-Tisochrysis_lutea.AAC.1
MIWLLATAGEPAKLRSERERWNGNLFQFLLEIPGTQPEANPAIHAASTPLRMGDAMQRGRNKGANRAA